MRSERIEADLTWAEFVVVRMLRRWSAVRCLGDHSLPDLVALAGELGETPHLAVSLHSLFQLTEGCLGRPLVAECCCSRDLAADERAILTLIASANPALSRCGRQAIPHGLPSALAWAAATARLMLGGDITVDPPLSCPVFGA